MLDGSFISTFYVIASIFGIGVVVIDALGLLGGGHDDGGHDGGGHDHGVDAAGEVGHAQGDHGHGDHGTLTLESRGAVVLSVLRYMRTMVYFCAGFGPIGILALWRGYHPWISLVWAIPCGLVSVWIVRKLLSFQSKEVDSSLRPEDLIFKKGEVIVSLEKDSIGKVRIPVGAGSSEQYALPRHEDEQFAKGDEAYVVEIRDDCVLVESEDRYLTSRQEEV